MTDPTALALLRDAESYLSALHGSVARHDHLAANLACAGCELRDRIAAALPTLTAVVPVSPPPADRAAVLREAADELGRMDYDTDSNDYGYDAYRDAWNGGVMDAVEKLRRLADETPAAACAECGHPCAVHREGDDPVTPGECTACPDDERHDYRPAPTPPPA